MRTTRTALPATALAVAVTAGGLGAGPAQAVSASVCGSGHWRLAATRAVYPGHLRVWTQRSRTRTTVCAVQTNESSRRQRIGVQVLVRSPRGVMTVSGQSFGSYTRYAGPLVRSYRHGTSIRVMGYGQIDTTGRAPAIGWASLTA